MNSSTPSDASVNCPYPDNMSKPWSPKDVWDSDIDWHLPTDPSRPKEPYGDAAPADLT